MQILGHGVDIAVCERIEQVWKRHGDLFLRRIFTPAEQEYCLAVRRPSIRLSGRFAAKEAILKALGTGWRGGIAWTDMEILNDGLGKPHATLSGACAARAGELGVGRIEVSISHTDRFAVASAIGIVFAARAAHS